MTDTGTKPDPVQEALTDLVTAGGAVRRLTEEHQAHAYVAALQGGQVPRIITEQTIDALKAYSTALLDLETATCATAPDAELRECKDVGPGDRVLVYGESSPSTVKFRTVLPPESNYYGGGYRFTFTDGTEKTYPRLARLHVEADRTVVLLHRADDAFGDGAA